jgi:hypothetical protein
MGGRNNMELKEKFFCLSMRIFAHTEDPISGCLFE